MLNSPPPRPHRTRWTALALFAGFAMGGLLIGAISFVLGQVQW